MTNPEANRPAPPALGKSKAPPPSLSAPPPSKARRRRFPVWIRLALFGLLLVLACVGGFLLDAKHNFDDFTGKIYNGPLPTLPPELAEATAVPTPQALLPTPAPGEPTWTPYPTFAPEAAEPVETTEPLPPGRINILVLGTDKRTELQEEAARSDTLIVVSVDPQWKTAGILSVPRDLLVTVPGHGLQKINSAYFFGEYDKLPGGGPTLVVPTVSRYFHAPIQYYVTINFDGFEKVIDELGGIDLYVPEAIDDPEYPGPYNSYIHVHFNQGCQHMDGERALQYARTRHADSDFGRARRQQQVIKAAREKALQLDLLFRYNDLLNDLSGMIETNIPPDLQWTFAQLGTQISTGDIYTSQIDNSMVREVGANGELQMRWDKAKPMLDWFFGRGVYARLKPGTVLTPVPSPTAARASTARTGTARRTASPTPDAPIRITGLDEATATATAASASPSAISAVVPPSGTCP